MRLYKRTRHHLHGFCSTTTTGEVPRTNRHIFTAFVDITKAFDTICSEGLWKIMAKYGIPVKFIVKSFHEGMLAGVPDEGETSETI